MSNDIRDSQTFNAKLRFNCGADDITEGDTIIGEREFFIRQHKEGGKWFFDLYFGDGNGKAHRVRTLPCTTTIEDIFEITQETDGSTLMTAKNSGTTHFHSMVLDEAQLNKISQITLSPNMYGDSLPTGTTEGQLFFLVD